MTTERALADKREKIGLVRNSHGVAHRLPTRRYMPRSPRKYRIRGDTCQSGSRKQAGGDARLKQFAIPVAVGLVGQSTSFTATNDLTDRRPRKPKRLPVSVRDQPIATLPVAAAQSYSVAKLICVSV